MDKKVTTDEFTFNKEGLTGGMYIYVLRSINETDTGKLVIK